MTQAVIDAFARALDNHEQMRSAANAYLNKRKCSVQECVYHALPGHWMRRPFPGVICQKKDFASFSMKMKL